MSAKAVPVADYLAALTHPLRAEIDAVRVALAASDPELREQIKWNAPSFSIDEVDLVTLMLKRDDQILVIFHHPETPQISSPILGGDYPDGRRITTLHSMDEVRAASDELTSVTRQLVARVRG